ncbi:hypothetical protein Sme01_59490 [Sphaerisporangium melleum]|uniref:HIRAN domain-containing protein n=1 Tax=Sphaerisporangium melleum TaxID=321316 RepID=A0A917R789_9ACTN|nr:hypothetical protein [Sphaerisporangium melleum]GGK92863.1 hypothetical protein GCM10007964_39240 [Sphaerisporangium melleum]GII73473.1 hypothetical protein Sme01_59490 [Sphaerisporangium melleum]
MVIGKGSSTTHGQAARLTPFDLWGHSGWCNQEVAGESHYLPALERVLRAGTGGLDEFETSALLVPEPANRHDPSAVAVLIQHETVGYLPRKDAVRYQGLLNHLAGMGFVARVPCRVWGGMLTDNGYDRSGRIALTEQFRARVSIALAEPHLCLPVNAAPQGLHVVLPQGGSIQVSGEEHHLAEIRPLLRPEGESYAYVTLHEVSDSSGRTVKQLVEVRLDGNRVGQLTPKMSGELLPAIRHLDGIGYLAASRAKLKGNHLKAEVTLHCVRAHELPNDWPGEIGHTSSNASTRQQPETFTGAGPLLDGPAAIRPHRPIPPKPSRIRFAVPPGWPPPPEGWEPPPGWLPDPSWPLAPGNWSFWVVE